MSILPNVAEVVELANALAPGLIILTIRSRVMIGSLPDYKDRLIAYALVSAAYFAGITPWFHVPGSLQLPPFIWGTLQYFVIPAVIGVAAAYINQYELAYRLARALGLELAHHIPAAWDFAFSRIRAGTFILVRLTDDSLVAGRMGRSSFASSSREERDLLVEEIWQLNDEGAWSELVPRRSILISAREIRYVEIFRE